MIKLVPRESHSEIFVSLSRGSDGRSQLDSASRIKWDPVGCPKRTIQWEEVINNDWISYKY